MTVVLDSWAVLRYLEDASPAAEAVSSLLGQETPLMSWINLGEVHYVLPRLHGEDAATGSDLRDVTDARLPDEGLDQRRPDQGRPPDGSFAACLSPCVWHTAHHGGLGDASDERRAPDAVVPLVKLPRAARRARLRIRR